jgi:PhzF family phenazine biosynthesis protein
MHSLVQAQDKKLTEYKFWQVDAFSRQPYLGNPAAIVFEADGIKDDDMQTVARQFNLSETVFLSKASTVEADYRARIFTPVSEIPFAGHPTVAAAFSVYSNLDRETKAATALLGQECGVGIIPVEIELLEGAPLFTLTADVPAAVNAGLSTETSARMLGVSASDIGEAPAEVCSGGLPWLIIPLKSLLAVTSAVPDQSLIERICSEKEAIGLTIYSSGAEQEGLDYHLRTFAPGCGINEDPVCGSGSIAVAIHLARHVRSGEPAFTFRAEQGAEVHRRGVLHLSVDGNDGEAPRIRLGGHAVKTMEGVLRL